MALPGASSPGQGGESPPPPSSSDLVAAHGLRKRNSILCDSPTSQLRRACRNSPLTVGPPSTPTQAAVSAMLSSAHAGSAAMSSSNARAHTPSSTSVRANIPTPSSRRTACCRMEAGAAGGPSTSGRPAAVNRSWSLDAAAARVGALAVYAPNCAHRRAPICAAVAAPAASTSGSRGSAASGAGDAAAWGPVSDASKAAGCLLGAMCGNVLGAPHQDDRAYQVVRRRPEGVTNFWRYDMSRQPVPFGHYTGDFTNFLAVAQSLLEQQGASAEELLASMASAYVTGDGRRYSQYDGLVLEAALSGTDVPFVPSLAEQYLASATQRFAGTSSDRADREPYGPTDYNAAARAAPIGLAYRDAPELLLQAVRQNCEFTHPTPLGLDAAHVLASAVAWLCRQQPDDRDCTPAALLQHLIMDVAQTTDMLAKLRLLQESLIELDEVTSWQAFYAGPQWAQLVRLLNLVSFHGYATAGSEAVSVSLLALLTSWRRPEQAVVVAASFGGNAAATAQMAGAMAGALWGDAWVPARWRAQLENGAAGRDNVLKLAAELSDLRCSRVGPLPEQQPTEEGVALS